MQTSPVEPEGTLNPQNRLADAKERTERSATAPKKDAPSLRRFVLSFASACGTHSCLCEVFAGYFNHLVISICVSGFVLPESACVSIRLPVPSFACLFGCLFACFPLSWFVCLFICLFICSFVCSLFHLVNRLLTCWLAYLLVFCHSFCHSVDSWLQ